MNNTGVAPSDRVKSAEVDASTSQSRKLEAIGRLAGGVAHDFNNHLTVILGCCQLLQSMHPEGTETNVLVAEVERAGERAAALTRQLLAFSRKQAIQLVVLNLNDVVTNLVTMLRRLINESIGLRTDLASPLPNVLADAGQIEQVIMNLVVNARDAMPHGGELRVETRQVVVERAGRREEEGIPPGSYATVVVRDSRCGMGGEVLAHLFEPFFTTKEPGKGTGLGLATVYGIVKQCKGHIRVASTKGVGTRFRIYFPAVEGPVRQEPTVRAVRPPSAGKGTILLAEDEQSVRNLASQALRTSGYSVLEAGNGKEALAVVAQSAVAPDLVLTDVIMPLLSGPQLVSELLPRYPGLKVIYMSGYTDSYLPFDAEHDSQVNLLHKPFTPSALLDTIEKAMLS